MPYMNRRQVMSPYHAAHIGCRIGAIFMFTKLAATGAFLWQQMAISRKSEYPMPFLPDQAAILISIIVYGVASFVMWDRAGWLAKLVAGPDLEPSAETAGANWGGTAFRAVGLFVILDRLSGFVDACRQKFFVEIPQEGSGATFWAELVVLLIALFVLIGADRISSGARWYFGNTRDE